MNKILLTLLAAAWLVSCSPPAKPNVPESWRSGDSSWDTEAAEAVEKQVGRFLELNSEALEKGSAAALASKDAATPWHFEYFMTDLSVSASGTLGALIGKGTPAVTFVWRQQYERPRAKELPPAQETAPDFEILAERSGHDVSIQLEPVIRSLVKAGIPETMLRTELKRVAEDFTRVTSALERTQASEWWVSRFRMDVIIEASGTVSSVVTAGGEARLRFEWHRMMPKVPLVAKSEQKGEIEKFVETLQSDVAEASRGAHELRNAGFEPYQFRVGVGYTEKGTIGVAKAQGTVIGQIYFSKDVRKPVVHPSPSPMPSKDDPTAFKKGLERAFKIASVFARGTRRAEAARPSRHWKVYELKAGFDLTLTEKLAVTEVGGVGTTEVNFYNQNF